MTIEEVRGVERRGRLSCTITASVSGYLLAGSVTFTATWINGMYWARDLVYCSWRGGRDLNPTFSRGWYK